MHESHIDSAYTWIACHTTVPSVRWMNKAPIFNIFFLTGHWTLWSCDLASGRLFQVLWLLFKLSCFLHQLFITTESCLRNKAVEPKRVFQQFSNAVLQTWHACGPFMPHQCATAHRLETFGEKIGHTCPFTIHQFFIGCGMEGGSIMGVMQWTENPSGTCNPKKSSTAPESVLKGCLLCPLIVCFIIIYPMYGNSLAIKNHWIQDF